MDVDVTVLADIRRPREEVAAFASDPRNVPRWYANIRSVDVLTDGPVERRQPDAVRRDLPGPHHRLHL